MSYRIIDNFLTEDEFNEVYNLIFQNPEGFEWFFATGVTYTHVDEMENWATYFIHTFYIDDIVNSRYFHVINPIFKEKFRELDIGFKSWMRIKTNLYPYTEKVQEHASHVDYVFPHKAAIFSLNTCDGFTRMSDGSKVDSVANRLLLFDASLEHNSTTTSNSKYRANINFNYL